MFAPIPRLVVSLIFVALIQVHCQQLENRIMKGLKVEIGRLPYLVAFYLQGHGVVGTGSIISEKWVLTAGHTWDLEEAPYITNTKDNTVIKYGTTVIDEDIGETASINEIFVHHGYTPADADAQYDVAVVQVVDKLNLKPGVAEVKPLIEEGKKFGPGYICVNAGFGDTGDEVEDAKPHHLSFVPMSILKRSVCEKHLDVPENMICAGLLEVAAGGCVGDSGSPLTCKGRIYGVLSGGTDGCTAEGGINLSNFVLINNVRDFIRQLTGV